MLEWREAVAAPFPLHWRDILRARVPFYLTLTDDERRAFEDELKVFVYTKTFDSRDFQSVSEEMKVVIAATACRLTLNMPGPNYGRLRYIGVRGQPFRSPDGPVDERITGSAVQGKVTVSWPDLLAGLSEPHDGNNVGYHEFAHALDAADGAFDGIAPTHRFSLYQVWADVVSEGHAAVKSAVQAGAEPPIDAYAGKSEAEFFAVATEWFFERPAALREKMPAVYDLLARFYGGGP